MGWNVAADRWEAAARKFPAEFSCSQQAGAHIPNLEREAQATEEAGHCPRDQDQQHEGERPGGLELGLGRDAFDSLCQKAQTLNELGYGDGGATRPASQLLARHQQLAKTVKEKLRASQLGLQEHQVFEETLQSTWAWLREVQGRITAIDSTMGSKATLEKHLLQIQ
eukprot:g36821.t1